MQDQYIRIRSTEGSLLKLRLQTDWHHRQLTNTWKHLACEEASSHQLACVSLMVYSIREVQSRADGF